MRTTGLILLFAIIFLLSAYGVATHPRQNITMTKACFEVVDCQRYQTNLACSSSNYTLEK